MDSKVVSKLIRSEVWPVLRRLGFSKFDSRTAWRYRGPLVDVVNFQSFNTHLADGLGCTTFSFALNLGVYLRGSNFERRVKIGPDGTPRPQEYECSFRAPLKKRTPMDGFAREDIFYVAPGGRTMGAVMDEVLFLLEREAPSWFAAFDDLGTIVKALSGTDVSPRGTENLGLGASGAPGSYSAADLLASLQLERHAQLPQEVSAATCLEAIDKTVGANLDIFTSGCTTPVDIERDSRHIRDLLVRIRASLVFPKNMSRSHQAQCELLGSHWNFDRLAVEGTVESKPMPSARHSLWPTLRNRGFLEFTDRLAHRPNSNSIEVVAFVPLDPAERRTNDYPDGLFRIGVGVFWPKLTERDGTRTNSRGQLRPRLQDCFLEMWLMPAERAAAGGPTCFDSVCQAVSALANDAEAWFSIWRDPSKRECLLEQPDWAILTCYPTMRGHGSASSVPRALISAMFKERLATPLLVAFKDARNAVHRYPDHRQARYQRWVERVEAGWHG